MHTDHEDRHPEYVLIQEFIQAAGYSTGAIYEFGGFRLEVAEGRLQHNGVTVPLAPKEFETLRLLVERHGRLVSKQTLLDRVWAGTFVGDATIAQRISLVRKALATDTTLSTSIETVPKRGYRFVATVRVL